jgi:hypothetical protein
MKHDAHVRVIHEQGKLAWQRKPRLNVRIPHKRPRNVGASTLSELSALRQQSPASRGRAATDPVLGPGGGGRFWEEAFALGAFAGQFARPADRFCLAARLGFGRLLVSRARLHFPEDALALHLLLERLQRLIDVVVTDHDNYDLKLSIASPTMALP